MTHENRPAGTLTKVKGRWRWIILIALVAVGALVLYRGWATTQKKNATQRGPRGDVPVEVLPAARQNLTHMLRATGDITPLMQVDLYSRVAGYLDRINVRIGDTVRQGQVIAQIDPTDFQQKVKEVEAKVAQAKAAADEIEAGTRSEDIRQAEEAVKQAQSRFDNARTHRQRMEALYNRQIISKKDFDNADTECAVCEAQLSASQERLKQLKEGARREVRDGSQAKLREMESLLAQEQTRLQNSRIVAPFAGEIARKHVDAGALISSSTPLVTLVHTATVKIVANVLEKDIPLMKLGMKARVTSEAYPEKVFEGKVAQINSAVDLSTRTLQTEIYIPNSERLLKPGMFCKVEVALMEKPQTLLIRRAAVISADGGKPYVFVVEGKQASRRMVSLGYEQDELVEVLDGVREGDLVVVKGQEALRDRSTVQVVEGG